MEHFFKLTYKTDEKTRIFVEKARIFGVKTRIFGENFVKRNINKCKIIYNNKEHQIKEFFDEIDKNYKPGRTIKFKLRIFHNILNLS